MKIQESAENYLETIYMLYAASAEGCGALH